MSRIKNLAIVLATTVDGIIGINNDLPWEFGTQKADMKRFRELTTGNIVVMGSKTFESMGSKPLPKRKNIVFTSQNIASGYDNVIFINPIYGVEDFLRNICEHNSERVFIIGGANLIEQTHHLVSTVHLSIIDAKPAYTDTDNVVRLNSDEYLEGLEMQDNPIYHEADTESGNHSPYTFVDYKA